jgi:hypothetical protein
MDVHWTVEKIFLASAALATPVTTANAMQGFSACHAAGTTVTDIDGLRTSKAKMTSVETLLDALEACHRNERLTGQALMACALKELQDNYKYQQ